jgi:excinuclease ABC subunit B
VPFRDSHQPTKVAFELTSSFTPRGDQPSAIAQLDEGLNQQLPFQTLLGVTGSGKTFTIANVIQKQQRPTLIVAPNKTLAAQLYSEFKDFFPKNRVKYFVSYYDYFQPEAYIPSTDTFIEKDSAINEEIDKMRHSATKALLEATDTIIVASVSCIYGLGAPEEYFDNMLFVEKGQRINRDELVKKLVQMQYKRSEIEFMRGMFRVRGETIDIFPSDDDAVAIRLVLFGDEVEEVREIDGISGETVRKIERACVYPLSHHVTNSDAVQRGIGTIKQELKERLPQLRSRSKILEAERLEQRTKYDMELLSEIGFCPGIENYSRHMAGRQEGEPPTTLLDYFPKDFLLVIDESHVTVSQLGGMYRGDRSRKETLVEYGFRLPSALDNRPLKPEEFWERVGQTIFVSATPADFELQKSEGCVVEQVNRPTGLLDPSVEVRPALNQIDDLIPEIRKTVEAGDRVLVTTLTKKMSENLADYLREVGIKCRYLHSDITTIDRVEILRGLRKGDFDVLIGINLLREGLDIVETGLVAILDADKEGFLRSTRSLIQTMGRAARNINGRVILYGDKITDSMKEAIEETDRRRKIQAEYNKVHGIVPTSAKRGVQATLVDASSAVGDKEGHHQDSMFDGLSEEQQEKMLKSLKAEMLLKAKNKEYEEAAKIRDKISILEKKILFGE